MSLNSTVEGPHQVRWKDVAEESHESTDDGHTSHDARSASCCKAAYYPRSINSKGVALLVLWNFMIYDCVSEIMNFHYTSQKRTIFHIYKLLYACSLLLVYPLAGWLADVHYGS